MKLVIIGGDAAGANPIRPQVDNVDLKHIYNVKTLDDGKNIRNKVESMNSDDVVLIGGGYIGMEMVEAIYNQKKKVTIIERGKHLYIVKNWSRILSQK